MTKALFFIVLILTGFIYIFNVDKPVSDKLTFINSFKQAYVSQILKISDFAQKHLNQASTIESLKKQNEELEQFRTLSINATTTLTNLISSYSTLSKTKDNIELTKVISYVDFDDFTKVWLDTPKKDDQIQGLISENFTAGIVVNRAGKSLALLNGNDKCNYAVYLGDKKAPGIVHGYDKHNHLKVKFIPVWIDIKVGDEVITSGMDNIFFEGLKVGRIVSLNKMADMQEAIIVPYAKVLKEKFFYIYSHKIIEEIEKDTPMENLKKEKEAAKLKAKK